MDPQTLAARLRERGLAPRNIQNALQLRKQFMALLRPEALGDIDHAREAWATLCDRKGWRPSYRRRALSSLLRVLEVGEHPLLAKALSSRAFSSSILRHDRHHRMQVETASSHETRFYLHDCLPLNVRLLSCHSDAYLLLHRLTEGFIRHMRSACRHTLQKRLILVYRLLMQPPALIDHEATGVGADVVWERVRAVGALEWLRRLDSAATDESLTPQTFRVYLLVLRMLHQDVLGNHHDPIPADSCVTNIQGWSSSSSPEEDADTDTDDERAMVATDVVVRKALARVRARTCRLPQPPERFAFHPEELTAILDRSVSTRERLMVMLLATTGLRIGGLSRLRTTCRNHWGYEIPPDALTTIEKGNQTRTLVLLAPVRILLARYFREDRPPHSVYLFPAPSDTDRSIQPVRLWQELSAIFRRAGVTGAHAHPHTFRHTFVHMMRLLGADVGVIAKMIGHTNWQTTERVYSRFNHDELMALTADIPLFGGTVAIARNGLREQWKAVAARLNQPYEFSERELHQLK